MRRRRGCRPVLMAILIVLLACLVFGGLVAGLVWVGDVPLHAPRVIQVEPPPGDPVLPTTSFTLTFDQPMNRESVSAAFSILPAVPGSLEWNAARTQVTFIPAGNGFEPGTSYTLRLYDDARGALFQRRLARDLSRGFFLPTLLIESSPAPDVSGLGAYPELRASFSYDLDCTITPHTFAITPAADGEFDCQERTLTFRPTEPLAPDTAYEASLAHTFLAGDPVPRQGVSWSFRTAPPLSVTDLLPRPGHLLVDLHEPARITFNRPVDPDSAALHLTVVSAEGEPVAGQVTWEAAGSVLVFRPDAPWLPGSEYLIRIEGGVVDELGFTLQEPVAEELVTLPMLRMPNPMPGAKDVPLDSAIAIPFTRPMDRASVEAGLTVTPALDAAYTWDGDTLLVNPSGGLAASTHYTVSVAAGVRDATGAPLGSVHSWDLRTEPFLLDACVPSDAPLLSLDAPITLTFALPMDTASVRSALTISPRTSVELSWSDDRRTLVLSPETGWQPGVEYEVRLRGQAHTATSQQEMDEEQVWPFFTAPSEVHLGIGPNVQVLPGPGTRTFQALHRGADAVEWHLYSITPPQFIDLYEHGQDDPPAQVDTTGLDAPRSWRQDVPVSAIDWQPITVTLPSWVQPGLYAVAGTPSDPSSSGAAPGLLLAVTDHLLAVKRAPRARLPVAVLAITPAATTTTTVPVEAAAGTTATSTITVTPEVTTTAPIATTTPPTPTTPITATPEATTTVAITTTAPLTPTPTTPAAATPATTIQGRPVELLIWDTELATGAPVVSATVMVYDASGGVLAQGVTDAQGLLALTLPAGSEPLFVVSDRSGDLALSGLDATWGDADWQAGAPQPAHTIVIIPDRGIYHPGDTIRFSSIVRAGNGGTYTLPPEGTAVTLTIEDGQGQAAASQMLTTTARGTLHGELSLPGELDPGPWQLIAHLGADVGRTPIHVQAAAAATNSYVVVQPARPVYVVGEPITVTVVASADSGPLAGAPVDLAVHRAVPSAGMAPGVLHLEPAILTTHGTTGRDGRWTVALPPELFASETADILLALAATLGTMDGASASSYELVSVRPGAYTVELLLDRLGFAPGEQITISARALDRNSIPAVDVPVTATLLDAEGKVVVTGSADTGESGIVHFSTAPEEEGWYQLRIVVTDDAGHHAEVTQRLWVAGGAAAAPRAGVDVPALSVTPDRLHYAPGTEALLALHFPAAGPAILTVERSSVRSALPVELDAGTNVITLPIQAQDQPNIYASLSRWIEGTRHDHYLGTATAELPVPASGEQLSVTVTPAAESYLPGEEVTLQVGVVDSDGAPIRAEVSLSVAEPAMPAIAAPTSGLFTAFYAAQPHDVGTTNSLAPERQLVTEPTSPPEGETATPGDIDVSTVVPAGTVPDTLFWAPALLTDAGGQITVTFTLPEEPGEWQIIARAITTDTKVGEATASIVTTQPIAIRPLLPAFLVQGDVVTVTARVQSYLPQPVSATVTLDTPGLAVPGSPGARQQIVHLPARGSAHVSWQAAAAEPGSAEIVMQATATYRAARLAGRAAARTTLPIHPLTLPTTSDLAGQVDRVVPQATVAFTLPADTLDLARVDLFLTPPSDPAVYQVYVNDTLWQENSLPAGAREHLVLTYTDTLSPALLLTGENVLRLVVDGGTLYYTASVTTYLTPATIVEPLASTGAPVLRRSYHLPGTDDPVERVAAGELVEVRLWLDVPAEIAAGEIRDRLPAGLTIQPDSLAEWLPPDGPPSPIDVAGGIEGEPVTFYLTNLPPGTHRLSYLARATVGGRFIAPPAVGVFPSAGGVWSHSGTTRLRVTAAPE